MINCNNKKAYSSSIVLIGNFSPMMFQPYWFRHCSILSEEEYAAIEKNKEKTIISDPLTFFETENFAFRVESKRFTIIAKKEPFELMIDTFGKLQEKIDSVLIEKFGINFSYHIELDSADSYKRFGDTIAPKDCWRVFFAGAKDTETNKSGLASMTMKKQTDFGCINAKIEGSVHFKNAVFFDFNFHFDGNPKEPFDILDVSETVNDRFQTFAEYASSVSESLISEVVSDGE